MSNMSRYTHAAAPNSRYKRWLRQTLPPAGTRTIGGDLSEYPEQMSIENIFGYGLADRFGVVMQ